MAARPIADAVGRPERAKVAAGVWWGFVQRIAEAVASGGVPGRDVGLNTVRAY